MPILSRGEGGRLISPLPAREGRGEIVLGRTRSGSQGGGGLLSLSAEGQAQLGGNITLSEGSGITLTQVGQDIEIAVT